MFKETKFETYLDWISFLLFGVTFILIFLLWSYFPNQILLVNAYSTVVEKKTMIGFPLCGMIIWLLFSFIERDSKHKRLPLNEEEANESDPKQNQFILNVVKNMIVLFFLYITWTMMRTAINI